MENKKLEKTIEHHINEQGHFWLAFLGVFGGTITLFLNADNVIKVLFVILGIIATCLLFWVYLNKSALVVKLINNLKEEEK